MTDLNALWTRIWHHSHDLTAQAEGTWAQCKGIHWPGGASGVTLGQGFDMGMRSVESIRKYLAAARISAPWLADASRLQGEAARLFVRANRGKIELTPDQMGQLFTECAQEALATVVRVSEKPFTKSRYGRVDFSTLNPALLALVVDLCYRGDYRPETRTLGVQSALVANSPVKMAECMANKYWDCVPDDRHRRRLEFCKRNMEGAS